MGPREGADERKKGNEKARKGHAWRGERQDHRSGAEIQEYPLAAQNISKEGHRAQGGTAGMRLQRSPTSTPHPAPH